MDRFIVNLNTREIVLISAAIAILFVQEQVLTFLPNIQFTTLLIFVYSRVFKLKLTAIIITVHVLFDNLYMGSLGMPNIVIPMFLGWMIIPILLNTVFKKVSNVYILGIIGYLFGHIYGLIFVPFQAMVLDIDIRAYLIADIPFEIIMGVCNYVTIVLLFEKMYKVIHDQYRQYSSKKNKFE